jgi:hypothetical protein
MNLNEYSTWLINFSDKYAIADERSKLTVYIAGLIEELNEYNLADTVEGKKKELGDLLAYLVLALNKVGFPPLKSALKFEFDNLLSVSELSLQLAGFLKRLYRGDNNTTDCVFTLLSYHDFIINELKQLNLTTEELIEINVAKLTKRDVNNTLKGSGDNR